MDYKQKYEQLAKFIKDLYPFMSDYCKEKTEGMIPELKESEDERMRKGIIRNLEYLADRAEGFVKDELKERIAWLEKQGEQKPVEWSEEDKKILGKVLECIRFAEDHYQLEEEEANGVSVKMWLLDHINPQPKQEWSEEDEGFFNLLLAIYEHTIGTFSTDNIPVFKGNYVHSNKIVAWLKSLKERLKGE